MASDFQRSAGKGFGDINPQSGSPKAPGIKDLVELFDFGTKAAFRPARFVGPIEAIGLHKIKIKKKDGDVIEIQKPCLAFDRKTGLLDSTKVKKCPYCQMGPQQYLGVRFFSNVIDRDEQENMPKKPKPHTKSEIKAGFRSIDSEAWSPVKVLGMPSSLTKRIKEIDERNLKKDKKGHKKHYEIRDPEHGVDVELKFNKKEQAANMYSAVKSDDGMTPLSKDERKLLLWDLTVLYPKEDYNVAKKEAESMATRMPDDIAKEMKKAGKGKASSDSSASGSDSSGSASEDSDSSGGKKSKSKSKKGSSDSSASGSGSDSSGSGSGSGKDSSDSASASSSEDSDSGSDSSGSKSSDSSEAKGKKGSKDKASAKSKGGKDKSGHGKRKSGSSDSSGSEESDVSGSDDSSSEASDSSGDKKKSKSKKGSSDSSGSTSGSDLSGLDSASSASSDSDAKSKKKKKK